MKLTTRRSVSKYNYFIQPVPTCIMLNINFDHDWSISEGANCIASMGENTLSWPFGVILSCYGHEIKQPIKFLVLIRTTDLIGLFIW